MAPAATRAAQPRRHQFHLERITSPPRAERSPGSQPRRTTLKLPAKLRSWFTVRVRASDRRAKHRPSTTALKPSRHTPPIQRCLLHGPVWFVGSLCQRRFTRSLGLLCLTAEQHGSIGKLLAYLLLISNQTMFMVTGYHPTTPEIPSFVFNRNEKTATELDK